MKELRGSEKQIKWAEDIRAKFAENHNPENSRYYTRAIKNNEEKKANYRRDFELVMNVASASRWIDNRNLTEENFQKAEDFCITNMDIDLSDRIWESVKEKGIEGAEEDFNLNGIFG